jgi:hypothetical protein
VDYVAPASSQTLVDLQTSLIVCAIDVCFLLVSVVLGVCDGACDRCPHLPRPPVAVRPAEPDDAIAVVPEPDPSPRRNVGMTRVFVRPASLDIGSVE